MIAVCSKCLEPIYPYLGTGWWVHQDTGNHWCQRRYTVATFGIEAWETEDAMLIVVGAYDRFTASLVGHRMYEDADVDGPSASQIARALAGERLRWVNRQAPEFESERWPSKIISDRPTRGWAPLYSVYW